MTRSGYIRSQPRAEVTPSLYTTRYALELFNRRSCKRILDLGCGEAFFEERYPERFVGIDIDTVRLVQAHERAVPNLILGNGENLPFVDASFDGALLKDVLEHFYLEEAFRVLREVSRILKTDGTLVVTTTKDTQSFWDKPDHVRPYSNKWVRRVLVQELGKYELIAARELSGGIRVFGKLHLESLGHALADHFGIRNTHGIITLRKIQENRNGDV
jgi:ubiquinone/menaquinone biosynthesis C-methylase UbiE